MTEDVEEWRPVVGWEGSYEVSDQGRVRSIDRVILRRNGRAQRWRGRERSLGVKPDGHHIVKLSRYGEGVTLGVHRLVLEAFVGPCPAGMEACHGPGGPADNRVSNLRWDTRFANMRDLWLAGTHERWTQPECKFGHPLVAPNLAKPPKTRPNVRKCLACHRAHGNVQYARKLGVTLDMQREADRHFKRIMREIAA